jgi:mannose-1-phosphate guanylyltransferase
MSRTLRPKQFLGVTEERSLFQLTLARLQGLQEASLRPMVVANTDHRFLVAEQCRTSGVEPLAILLEPMARNTAPAIAAAAFAALALSSDQDPVLLVLPSDHTFANVPAFHQSVVVGIEAAKAGNLVTFGIVPTHPETGYGYVKAGQALNAKEAVHVD